MLVENNDINPSVRNLSSYDDAFHKVLLIEDNPGDSRLVEIKLHDSDLIDCEVTTVETLSEGFDALRESNFSVTLLDLTLPDSSGFETLERFLTEFPGANVIVLTGIIDQKLGIKAIKAGAQDYIVKGEHYHGESLPKSLRFSIERSNAIKSLAQAQSIAKMGNWEYNIVTQEFTASDEVYRIFGHPPYHSDADAIRIWSQVHEEDSGLLNTLRQDVFDGKQVQKEIRIFDTNKQEKHVSVTCSAILNRYNEVHKVAGIIQDMTQWKRTEELKKAKEVAERSDMIKQQFIASVSHDMRTPLNIIKGMSNLLSKTELTEDQANKVGSILDSANGLNGIINDILEVSNIRFRGLEVIKENFSLTTLLGGLKESFQFKITQEKEDLDFSVQIEEGIPSIMLGDRTRLHRVLLNLISNAVKFTETGFIKVNIGKVASYSNKIKLKFDIEDTGIGIPKDKLESIFEAFSRVVQKDRFYEGTGLGLNIVKNIVESNNGEIHVTSDLGRGSLFSFTFEFENADEESSEGNSDSGVITLPNRPLHILLVEDNKLNQIVAKQTLIKAFENLTITIADNGKIAIDFLNESDYDLILMDVQMPIMDGYETTAYIRNEMTGYKSETPILAMTADAFVAKEDQFLVKGMNDYVLKPFEPDNLFRKIAQHIRK